MEKRYQIRVGTHKVDFYYDADVQTWRARRPGTQDYTTGPAGTLEAARDAVRRHIEDEEPPGESLHSPGQTARHAGSLPPGTAPAPPSRESGNGARRRAAVKGQERNRPPAERGKGLRRDSANSVPYKRAANKAGE